MRDRLGIMPGDEVEFELDESGVRVLRTREKSSLRGSLSGLRLADELLADRRAERDR